jgi:hypothetical protein
VLDLFRGLISVPVDEREDDWQRESWRLAAALGVEDEWFCGKLDVCDPALDWYKPPAYWGGEPWDRIMAMRESLLAEVAKQRHH